MHLFFSHGKDSAPWGGKISSMAPLAEDRGLIVHSVDYRGIDDPGERVEKLIAEAGDVKKNVILVGSSMGAHVAAAASTVVPCVGMFLMAPAFYIPGHEHLTPEPADCPVHIVHGWHDDVIPYENSVRYAAKYSSVLHLIDGDHRLLDNMQVLKSYFDLFLDSVANS
jgi:pimeloyl-ACP methyl ester carboxylesterase